jgi:hypothetical protein
VQSGAGVVVRCSVIWRGVMCCGAVQLVWCRVVWYSGVVVRCSVVWCGVVCYNVVGLTGRISTM